MVFRSEMIESTAILTFTPGWGKNISVIEYNYIKRMNFEINFVNSIKI